MDKPSISVFMQVRATFSQPGTPPGPATESEAYSGSSGLASGSSEREFRVMRSRKSLVGRSPVRTHSAPTNPAETIRGIMTDVIERTPSREPVLRVQGLEMNLRTSQVRHRGESVQLTPTEFRLLRMLMLNANRVSPSWLLERALGGPGRDGRKVQFYVARLRRKLGDRHRILIRTAHGAGYWLAGRTVPPS
jgi:DNA-binding response OmpR family regulator